MKHSRAAKERAKILGVLLWFVVLAFPCWVTAQTGNSLSDDLPAPGHRGAVTALLFDPQGRILSAGADGFLEIWSPETNSARERFQISPHRIRSMALRPGMTQAAFVEVNGAGYSRISVWDYEVKQNLFTLPFGDTMDRVYYSAAGSFLLAVGREGVSRVHSETGVFLNSPPGLTGEVTLAATGRSERTMVTYLSSGYLSYWDLETGTGTYNFSVPRDIRSPLLLGNNRFLAGFDDSGLLILDAVSGRVILREAGISKGTLFTGNPEGLEFVCLVPGERYPALGTGSSVLYHLGMKNLNRLEILNRRTVASTLPVVTCGVVTAPDSAALGTGDGRVAVINQDGDIRIMDTLNQRRIVKAAASSKALAFFTENSRMGFIPLDFTRLDPRNPLGLEDSGPYTSIAASPEDTSPEGAFLTGISAGTAAGSDFLLWQPENTRSLPLVKQISEIPERGSVSEKFIDKPVSRFPLRAVSVYKNQYLFLDSVGNIRLMNQNTGEITFTYSSSGSQDAVILNDESILVGRNAGISGTPFLIINTNTGETVPLPYPADLGAKVYRGSSGLAYGVAVSRRGNGLRTFLVAINTGSPLRAYSLGDYEEETAEFTATEAGGYLASTLGGRGARIFRITTPPGNFISGTAAKVPEIPLERGPGLPLAILNGGDCFVTLDSDGNIAWHDPLSGKILAVFRLYADRWILERDGKLIRGSVTGN